MGESLDRRKHSSKVPLLTEGSEDKSVSLSELVSIDEIKNYNEYRGQRQKSSTPLPVGNDSAIDNGPLSHLRKSLSLGDDEIESNNGFAQFKSSDNSQRAELNVARLTCRRTFIEPPKVEIRHQTSQLLGQNENYGVKLINDMYWYLLRDCGFDQMFGLCDEEDEDREENETSSSVNNKPENLGQTSSKGGVNKDDYRFIRSSASISSSNDYDEEAFESVNRRISDLLEQHAIAKDIVKGSPRGVMDEIDAPISSDNRSDTNQQGRRENEPFSITRNLF